MVSASPIHPHLCGGAVGASETPGSEKEIACDFILNLLFEEVIESRVRFVLYKFQLVSCDNNFDIGNT